MSLTLSDTSSYMPAPQGTHVARCTHVIDLGTQDTPFGIKQQVWMQFELVSEPAGTLRNHSVSRFYTRSLNKKAALRADLEGWRGRSFAREELASLDLAALAATPCQLIVGHAEKQDGTTRAEIRGITALPRGTEAPQANAPLFVFDIDTRDKHALDDLPDWLRDIVLKAKEWETPAPTSRTPPGEPFDDDIPAWV